MRFVSECLDRSSGLRRECLMVLSDYFFISVSHRYIFTPNCVLLPSAGTGCWRYLPTSYLYLVSNDNSRDTRWIILLAPLTIPLCQKVSHPGTGSSEQNCVGRWTPDWSSVTYVQTIQTCPTCPFLELTGNI